MTLTPDYPDCDVMHCPYFNAILEARFYMTVGIGAVCFIAGLFIGSVL